MPSTVKIESEKAKNALGWIINVLQNSKQPYQITGGLAAKFYGSNRPLVDIDIDVPNKTLAILFPVIKPFLIYGPERYKDDDWDILLATINYNDQLIDLSGADDGQIFDKKSNRWTSCEVDFSTAVETTIENINVKIIEKFSLIKYKSCLRRAVDLQDITNINA